MYLKVYKNPNNEYATVADVQQVLSDMPELEMDDESLGYAQVDIPGATRDERIANRRTIIARLRQAGFETEE